MKPFTFDQIPVMMSKIHDKLDYLEKLILRISTVEENKEELLNIQEASKLLNLSVVRCPIERILSLLVMLIGLLKAF